MAIRLCAKVLVIRYSQVEVYRHIRSSTTMRLINRLTYLLTSLLTAYLQSALCPVRYLVQPPCTLSRLLSANSLFICSCNLFLFISLTLNSD